MALGGLALSTVAVVDTAVPASAANECDARARVSFSADQVDISDFSGSCSYLRVQHRYQPPSSGVYTSTRQFTSVSAGTIYRGYVAAELINGRACSDTGVDSCSFSTDYFTNTDWYDFN